MRIANILFILQVELLDKNKEKTFAKIAKIVLF